MIRASGILGLFASLVILGVLLRGTHSAELVATVQTMGSTSVVSGDRPTLHLGFPGSREEQKMQLLRDAGIVFAGIHEVEGRRERTFWVAVPDGVVDAAQLDDQVTIRSRRLKLGTPGFGAAWTFSHVDLGRGAFTRTYPGAENRKFMLVFGGAVAAPLALWGLAAGITGLARLRRGPSTSPPGSPGTPGSP